MAISAIILTKNNEKTLPNLLKSLSWCDERLVIDDGSTDQTQKVALSHGATVYARDVAGDFAAQRNFALKKAVSDWALFVDSDELVSGELQHEIQQIISQPQAQEGNVGYFIKRDDIFFGKRLKYGETAHVYLLRLARINAGVWKRPIHEFWDAHGHTGTIHKPILHHAHDDVAQFINDINAYSTLNAQYFYSQGVRSNGFSVLMYPLAKFIQNYLFRLGFLDGTEGCIMALSMGFHSFLTRAKLYMQQNH